MIACPLCRTRVELDHGMWSCRCGRLGTEGREYDRDGMDVFTWTFAVFLGKTLAVRGDVFAIALAGGGIRTSFSQAEREAALSDALFEAEASYVLDA